jgi:hypothetical protein
MPRSFLNIAIILGCLVLGSGALVAAAAISNSVAGAGWRPSWFLFGFELVITLAGVLCLRLGRGKYGSPGLGLLCVAGTVAAGTLFGYLGAGRTVWGIDLKPLLAARGALALALLALAGAIQLHGEPVRVRFLVKGIIFAIPALALPAIAYALRNSAANWPEVIRLALLMVGFVAVIGFIAASVEFLVRAFAPKDTIAKA